MSQVYFDDVRTRFGTFRLAASERGLTAVQFPKQFKKNVIPAIFRRESMDPRHFRRRTSSSSRKVLRASARALKRSGMTRVPESARKALLAGNQFLKRYFSGKIAGSFHIPVDWRGLSLRQSTRRIRRALWREQRLTIFETRVLKTLRKTPPSSILSYSDLAKRSGCQAGARAVGNALARNPLPILVPCHRVVRKDQSLGGFSGGLHWKRTLLKLERIDRRSAGFPPKRSADPPRTLAGNLRYDGEKD